MKQPVQPGYSALPTRPRHLLSKLLQARTRTIWPSITTPSDPCARYLCLPHVPWPSLSVGIAEYSTNVRITSLDLLVEHSCIEVAHSGLLCQCRRYQRSSLPWFEIHKAFLVLLSSNSTNIPHLNLLAVPGLRGACNSGRAAFQTELTLTSLLTERFNLRVVDLSC